MVALHQINTVSSLSPINCFVLHFVAILTAFYEKQAYFGPIFSPGTHMGSKIEGKIFHVTTS
jgi:hypothetical protein